MTVSLEQVKSHLRVNHSSEDALIATYSAAATAWIGWYCGDRYDGDAPEIVAAELLLTGHFYTNREVVSSDRFAVKELPFSVRAWAAPFRKPALA